MGPRSRVRHSLDSITAIIPGHPWPHLTAGTLCHHNALPLSNLQLGSVIGIKVKDVDALVLAGDTAGLFDSWRCGIVIVVTLKVQQ